MDYLTYIFLNQVLKLNKKMPVGMRQKKYHQISHVIQINKENIN